MTVPGPHSILPPIHRGRAAILRLLPNIRYDTARYPEKVPRLRALNIATWIASVVASGFAIVHFLDPTPGLRKVAAVNALAAVVCAGIPLLHRLGPLVASVCLLTFLFVYLFVVLFFLGSGTGMHLHYLVAAGLLVLFFGTERIFLTAVFVAAAAAFLIAVEALVPRNTGLLSATRLFGGFIAATITACTIQ